MSEPLSEPISEPISVAGLVVDATLHAFVESDVLQPIGIDPAQFFGGLGEAIRDLAPLGEQLLRTRAELQDAIDGWHDTHGAVGDLLEYRHFLEQIGYLAPSVAPFQITTTDVDMEIREMCAPQLIVPVTNARYALNAVNARWGSLYDALYGSDALGAAPVAGPYDPKRGSLVVRWVRSFLDDILPLQIGSHAESRAYAVEAGRLLVTLAEGRVTNLRSPGALLGYVGDAARPSSLVLQHHGLRLEIVLDRSHPAGAADPAGVADVLLEAAVTTIIDFEDSVACVDADEKVSAYRNWLGLVNGGLAASVPKAGTTFVRRLNEDRLFTSVDGTEQASRGRALLLARIVGLHMATPSIVDSRGKAAPETILDAFVVAAIAMHDRLRPRSKRNSRHGSIYLVIPKLHGPDEVEYACKVLSAAERTLALPTDTLKVGIMDEERRTTVNLEACVRAAASRIVFINTGFLDRTGDEIHTSMRAGPMVRKADMKKARWIQAYEKWNVDVGLRCGFSRRAQIGKGMWAMPDRMSQMLEEKIGHPMAGASCAWVPSPTAATLHATHYHRIDVEACQRELAGQNRAGMDDLLTVPVASRDWDTEEIRAEVDNNVHGILGYVVRWVDQGVGCSKVLDVHDVGLMEDRATCRISSQHVANWLSHGIVSADDVEASLRRMARVVDSQNAGDTKYQSMAPTFDGAAFMAAHDLVFNGTLSPSGYTEPILHARRIERMASNSVEA